MTINVHVKYLWDIYIFNKIIIFLKVVELLPVFGDNTRVVELSYVFSIVAITKYALCYTDFDGFRLFQNIIL